MTQSAAATAPETATSSDVFIGCSAGGATAELLLKYANRHGVIAGATGTGKTFTLCGIAEDFSRAGVNVFIADIKGDLAGIAAPGVSKPPFEKRAEQINHPLSFEGFPTTFWDIFGKDGHPVRITVSEMGPLLLSRLLDLNDTQEGLINIAFKVADEEKLWLIDFKDLRSLLAHIGQNAKEYSAKYGNVATATVGAVQRALLGFEQQGAANFFGEPGLELKHLLEPATDGRGRVHVLAATQLMQRPKLYSMFMLWLLSELFEQLPEVGDQPKPKLVFFFDEAHLLFDDAPKALLEKIEQLVRLIRSKGVGVFFITQNTADIPEDVLGQLGNRVQHALRAFTPKDQKSIKAAADSFRENPAFNTKDAITELGVGEALVSCLDAKGSPVMVERILVKVPSSRVAPLTALERAAVMQESPYQGIYDTAIDRESAFEILAEAAKQEAEERAEEEEKKASQKGSATGGMLGSILGGALGYMGTYVARYIMRDLGRRVAKSVLTGVLGGATASSSSKKKRSSKSSTNSLVSGLLSGVGRQVSSSVVRGVLGSASKRR